MRHAGRKAVHQTIADVHFARGKVCRLGVVAHHYYRSPGLCGKIAEHVIHVLFAIKTVGVERGSGFVQQNEFRIGQQ